MPQPNSSLKRKRSPSTRDEADDKPAETGPLCCEQKRVDSANDSGSDPQKQPPRLTRSALRELQHQIAQATPPPSSLTRRKKPSRARRGSLDPQALSRFARHGGPDLRDIISYPNLDMPPKKRGRPAKNGAGPASSDRTPSSRTSRTSPYEAEYKQALIDNQIYPPDYNFVDRPTPAPPDNQDEVMERLDRARPSLSPEVFGEDEYLKFRKTVAACHEETLVSMDLTRYLEGEVELQQRRCGNVPFGNITPLTDPEVTHAKPDLYYGAAPELVPVQMRTALSNIVEPTTDNSRPVAPNMFLEYKGKDGSTSVAELQAVHYGAIGARAIHALENYGLASPVFDGNVKAISVYFYNGFMRFYGTYVLPPTPAKPDRPVFVTAHLTGFDSAGRARSCREGLSAYRNALEWTLEVRTAAINTARTRFSLPPEPPLNRQTSAESDSTDELARAMPPPKRRG